MPQGILRLKKDAGGYRHYIELPDGSHDDIHCGSQLEVQLGRWKEVSDGVRLEPGPWIKGRYEAYLAEPVSASLVIGDFYPDIRETMTCMLPVGIRVRRPEGSDPD